VTTPTSILVVEDDEILRDTIAEVLTDEGHDVRLAANGGQALDQMVEWEPAVVVLDLMMPEMDAYEFRRIQRSSGTATAACILVLSAVPDIEAAAIEIGADAWLAKPFSVEDLVAVVDDLVDRRTAP
jgi:two-component system response regulator MprA